MSGALQAVYMNQRSFGTPFFFGRFGSTTTNQDNRTISSTLDGAGNFISAGTQALYQSNGTPIGSTSATILKIDQGKSTVFRKTYSQSGNNIAFQASAADSSNNIFTTGEQSLSGTFRMIITKVNSSGVLQWTRRLGISTGQTFSVGIGVDSGGSVYVGGYTQLDSATDKYAFLVAKYNTSGTIQWQKKLYQSFGNNIVQGFYVDSGGNCFLGGYSSQSGPQTFGLLAKYNSSGTLQFQRQFGVSTGSFSNVNGIQIDSSGSIYACCSTFDASISTSFNFTQKLDSSANTVQWARRFVGSALADIAVDSSSNVYVCGEGNDYDGYIVKYNGSGTIQWQRRLSATGLAGQQFRYWWTIGLDPDSQLGLSGITGQGPGGINNNLGMIARFPNTGAFLGTFTFGSVNYISQLGSGTDSSYSVSLSTASLTDSNAGLTDDSTTLTEADITTPVTLVNV